MAQKKESFFWTSYSDLMTSLFFVMLVLFVLVIVLLHKRMEATEAQLQEIKKIEESTKDLNPDYFDYRTDYKKFVLKIQARYPAYAYELNSIIAPDKEKQLEDIANAGKEIQSFLNKHKEYKYVLIVEGQASKDTYRGNYDLSYQRALSLMRYWVDDCKINFGDNCEILISGSGDGKLNNNSMRESEEKNNQRFLIHILPKNIFESTTNENK